MKTVCLGRNLDHP